jgi:phosphate starvation-inducible PhoH-like protein
MAAELYGLGDRTLRILEQELGVDVHARGNQVRLVGSEAGVASARKALEQLYACIQAGQSIAPRDVRDAIRIVKEAPDVELQAVTEDVLASVGSRRNLRD